MIQYFFYDRGKNIYVLFCMILNKSHQYATLVLTFQKKKLYYNRIQLDQLYLPISIIHYSLLCIHLSIQLNWMFIKRSFLIFILAVSILSFIQSKALISNFNNQIPYNPLTQIQLQKQAKKIPKPPRDETPFYLFKSKHSKSYLNPQQEVYRSIIYTKNQQKINLHNQKVDRTFNMGVNKFSDLSPGQFNQIYTTLYKSNDQIKGYAKNLVDLLDPIMAPLISQTQYMKNNPNQIQIIQDQVIKSQDKKSNIIYNENSGFSVVQQVFESSNPNYKLKQNTKTSIQSYLNQYLSFQSNILSYNQNQIQQQLSKIGLNTSISPLKLSNDTTSTNTTTSKSSITSTSGYFCSNPIDWTVHAGKVRYQGVCGACYTFATSDVVASLNSIYRFGFFVPLSTQQVVDCSNNGLTYGCNGGFLQGSYAYMQIKGIQTDSNYPYTSAVSGIAGTCKTDGGAFKINSFKNIQQGNCKALVNQLNYGPVSIGIAGYRLQFYTSGIFNDCNSYVDHAVVLISYKGGVGWKIKNSWGSDWGMSGFAWIADGNNCGICNMAVSARL